MTFLMIPTNSLQKFKLIFLFFVFLLSTVEAQQKAFPTAYGGGAYATGGRGGHVYHVTRLDDSSTKGQPTKGTFRWAVTQPRPATVVFDVSGTLVLDKSLSIEGDNITIAGQSAPRGGITLTTSNDKVQIKFTWGRHRIMSYIRIRPKASKNDAFEIYSGRKLKSYGDNTIFDHMSISYGGDEAFSIRGEETRNITFQRGLIAESTKGSLFGDISKSKDGRFSYDNSFLTTLWVNISHRTPNISGKGRFDVINNVIYDWKYRLSLIRNGAKVNYINNYYFMGNKPTYAYTYKNNPTKYSLNVAEDNLGDLTIFSKGNIIKNEFTDPNASNRIFFAWWKEQQTILLPSSQFTNTMMPLIGARVPIMTAVEASTEVPQDAGANKYLNADGTFGVYRDANDTDYLSIVQNDRPEPYEILTSGKNKGHHSFVNGKRYANFLASVSTTPTNTRPKNFYVSNPHIPEAFFKAHVPAGQNHNDIAPSGYTWLEEYLHGVYRANNVISVGSVEVSPSRTEVQVKETLQLKKTFKPQNASNQKGVWSSSNTKIATVDANGLVTAIAEGKVAIRFKSSDRGLEDESEITVSPGITVNASADVSICQGTSTTLTANGGSSYLWSTGEKTASIEVSPYETTTYAFTAYDSKGKEIDTDVVTVTVNELPNVYAGLNVTINPGETTTLTARGASSYRWSNGATTASIRVSPRSTTAYTVTGTRNGCESIDIVDVMVRDTGTNTSRVSAGEDHNICLGKSTTLTATGGSSYLWSTGEKTASIEVSPYETTTYSLTAFDNTGKKIDTDVVTVTVNELPNVYAGLNVTINPGETTTLTARGANSYRWSNGATTASIKVSPSSTTAYTVTGTRNGCEAIDIVDVMVRDTRSNASRFRVSAGEDHSICIGNSTTLTATGGSRYLWSTGETTASIMVSPYETTTYSLTAYDDEGKEIDTDLVTVTVNELPNVYAGLNVTINPGETTTLTATGATSYRWSNGATTASIRVSPRSTTAYTVTGTRNGCEAIDIIDVMVRDTGSNASRVSAGEDQNICIGNSTTLTATGGSSYLWSTGEKTARIKVSPYETTTYSLTAYDSNGKELDTDRVTVRINELPNVYAGLNVTINPGETTTLTATGANSYRWSNGATTASIKVSPRSTTAYTVTGTRNGCEAIDIVDVMVRETETIASRASVDIAEKAIATKTSKTSSSLSTGFEISSTKLNPQTLGENRVLENQLSQNLTTVEFLTYPNPTYDDLYIKISGLSNLSSIHLYDLSGKSLYNEIIKENGQHSYVKKLNLSEYKSGVYLLQLVDNQQIITKKIILK